MKKKEFSIGEEVQFGLVRLLVYENKGCVGCYFDGRHSLCGRKGLVGECLGECYGLKRTDGKSVIFLKVKED